MRRAIGLVESNKRGEQSWMAPWEAASVELSHHRRCGLFRRTMGSPCGPKSSCSAVRGDRCREKDRQLPKHSLSLRNRDTPSPFYLRSRCTAFRGKRGNSDRTLAQDETTIHGAKSLFGIRNKIQSSKQRNWEVKTDFG